jgi:hypothetical protein
MKNFFKTVISKVKSSESHKDRHTSSSIPTGASHGRTVHSAPSTRRQPTASTGFQPVLRQQPVAPIHSLPGEILFTIFVACAPSKHLSHSQIINGRYSPWNICQVSSRWRRYAIATPELWSTIVYNTSSLSSVRSTRYRAWLILNRSQNLPLTVKLHCDRPGRDWIPPSHPILEVLIQSVHRWERLDLKMSMHMLVALGPLRGRLSSLQHLSVEILSDEIDVQYSTNGPCTIFEGAHKLRAIEIIKSELKTPYLSFPAPNVKSFTCLCAPKSLQLLSKYSQVTHCTLVRRECDSNSPGSTFQPLLLPSLRILEISIYNDWRYPCLPVATTAGTAFDLKIILLSDRSRMPFYVLAPLTKALSFPSTRTSIGSLSLYIHTDFSGAVLASELDSFADLIHATLDVMKLEICSNGGLINSLLPKLMHLLSWAYDPQLTSAQDGHSLRQLTLKGKYDPKFCLNLLEQHFLSVSFPASPLHSLHGIQIRMVMGGEYAHTLRKRAQETLFSLKDNAGIEVVL